MLLCTTLTLAGFNPFFSLRPSVQVEADVWADRVDSAELISGWRSWGLFQTARMVPSEWESISGEASCR